MAYTVQHTIGSGIRVGCCGLPVGLARYAQVFSTVEVQQTFYQPPSVRTLENWRKKVPATFEFTLKAWQLITHEASSPTYRRLAEKLSDRKKREVGAFRLSSTVMAAWERTLDCARALSVRTILFQCPARFSPTAQNVSNLRTFFCEIDRRSPGGRPFTYIWEPRGDWSSSEIRELCDELGLVHGVDPLQQPSVTDALGYFRLHGRRGYAYRYTKEDLEHLLTLTRARESCYVFFNNVSMWDDARSFQALLSGL
jgi:uncharacterized protein YecE (DUF72 family)